jgi:hypothetical protein
VYREMMLQELFCSPSSKQTAPEDLETSILECDYDSDATNLYQAIESEAWVPVLLYLETGKWEHMYGKDPHSPERQARTWVTRFEPDGTVRWSQLPLHAAIIFNAPKKIILSLMNLYPLGVRCTDDQQMLPLHLAFKFGAEDSVITLLLERFPEALFTKNVRGRIPTEVEGPRTERTTMMKQVIRITTEHVSAKQGKFYQAKMTDLTDDFNLQTRLNATLESDKNELEEKLALTTAELAILKNECKALKEQIEIIEALKTTALVKAPMITGQTSRPTAATFKGGVSPLAKPEQRQREKELDPWKAVDDTSTDKPTTSTTSFVFGRRKKLSKDENSIGDDARSDLEAHRNIDGNRDSRRSLSSVNKDSDRSVKRDQSSKRIGPTPPKDSTRSPSKGSGAKRNVKPSPEAGLKKPVGRSGRSSPLQNFVKEPPTRSLQEETNDVASNSVSTFRTDERRSSIDRSSISNKVFSAGARENKGITQVKEVPEPHPGTRPRLPRHGFFQGFDIVE